MRGKLKEERRWEARSAGKGSKGDRWYAWAWIGTASPEHYLLIRRHLTTGDLAFHYCYVPAGQLLSMTRLIRAAGLRWPVEEGFVLHGSSACRMMSRQTPGRCVSQHVSATVVLVIVAAQKPGP